jgi:hypothetical protein
MKIDQFDIKAAFERTRDTFEPRITDKALGGKNLNGSYSDMSNALNTQSLGQGRGV